MKDERPVEIPTFLKRKLFTTRTLWKVIWNKHPTGAADGWDNIFLTIFDHFSCFVFFKKFKENNDKRTIFLSLPHPQFHSFRCPCPTKMIWLPLKSAMIIVWAISSRSVQSYNFLHERKKDCNFLTFPACF